MLFKKKKKSKSAPVDPWVENEIKLALADKKSEDYEYVSSCYSSAVEAYKVLLGQGHSGMSISITKFILDRLIDRKPLTSITEADFENIQPCGYDKSFLERKNLSAVYQCPRCPSLFKDVDKEGNISYSDNDRALTIDRNGATCHSNKVSKLIDRMFPIELPYWPGKPYKVYTAEFTYDSTSGSVSIDPGIYNAVYLGYIVTPQGEIINLDTFEFEDSKVKTVPKSLKDKLRKELIRSGLSPNVIKS